MSTEDFVSSFRYNQLTDSDALQASCFNELQLQGLQNELSIAAEAKMLVEFDPTNPLKFAQEEAYARGKMDCLKFLIANSKESAKLLLLKVQQQQSNS